MNTLIRKLAFLAVVSCAAHAMAAGQAAPAAKVLPDYTVFVDAPTGFVFLKLPTGWKFVGTVGAEDTTRLPTTVVTRLLEDEDEDFQAAESEAANKSR